MDILHEEVPDSDNCSRVVFVSFIGRVKSVYHQANSKANRRVAWEKAFPWKKIIFDVLAKQKH